ncbi:MAG: type II secretion system F family protein [Deltaproteobacteria bacterium]
MALFNYSALDYENTLKEGVLDGTDKSMVAQKLLSRGLRPLVIKPHSERQQSAFPSLELFRREKITRADIDFFTKQIAMLLDAGLSLDGALRVMKQNSNKAVFRDFTGKLERKLKEGKSFSQALAEHPQFSPMYVNIVKAGEEGGILPKMLTKMTEYQSTFHELKQFVISASIYPAFLLVVGFLAISMLLLVILPRFEVLFTGLGHDLPVNVALMMGFARLVRGHPFLALTALIAPPAILISYLRTVKGKNVFDRLMIRMPVLSGFVSDLETTRIFRTIQVLVENGVHLATALKIGSGVASNREYKRVLSRATEALKEGREVGKKLRSERLLPDLATDLLSIGEESGRVGEVCGQIADHYEYELRARVKRIIALVEPLFILLIALVAGWVVISMLSVILSINDIAV